MASLFEGYERRIDQINAVLNSYGISSIEEAEKITKDAGLDVYDQVKKIQPSVNEITEKVTNQNNLVSKKRFGENPVFRTRRAGDRFT